MNIIVTSSTYPASNTDTVPRFVKDQLLALLDCSQNLHITVLVPHTISSKNSPNDSEHDRLKIKRFRYFWPRRLEILTGSGIMPTIIKKPWLLIEVPFLMFFTIANLYILARKLKPRYIYAHWFTPQGIGASIVSRLTGVPYVLTTHSSDVYVWRKLPVLGKLVVRGCISNCRAITAVSNRTKQKLEFFFTVDQWKSVSSRVSVLPMGVNSKSLEKAPRRFVDETRKKFNLYESSFVFFFIGRLTKKKGVQYLLPSFAEILRRFPNVKLVISGEGEMKKELIELVHQLKIHNNVIFTGFVTGKVKQALLQISDAMVVPSIITNEGDAEGLPVSFMEGLAAGKICVATKVSGADDIATDGLEAFLVQDRDISELRNGMERAINISEQQKQTMVQAAQHLAQTLDWSIMASKYYELFKKTTKP